MTAFAPIMAPRKCLCCKTVRIFEPKWCCLDCMKVLMFMKDEIWAIADLPFEHPDKQAVIEKAIRHIDIVAQTAVVTRRKKGAA